MNLRKDLGTVTPKELLHASSLASYQVRGIACVPTAERGACLWVHPPNFPSEFQKNLQAEKWGQDPQQPLLCALQEEVLEWGSIRKLPSPCCEIPSKSISLARELPCTQLSVITCLTSLLAWTRGLIAFVRFSKESVMQKVQ